MDKSKPKVYVGVSGGVDSSVSAALLLEQGYDVTGVFIRVWYPPFVECDWKKERRDAMEVCAHLGISFKEFNAEEEYKQDVVDYMIREYTEGRTPNPDVMCNRSVKFGAFKQWVLSQGVEYVATGHYARVEKKGELYFLKAGIDGNKDQTYFLWTLTQEDLSHTLFPVGEMEKEEVRAYAEQKGLLTATKKDSQGICFLGAIDMKEFLSHYVDVKEGDVLNMNKEVIGRHKGVELYTLGERHGFEVIKKSPNDGPHYIISKDVGTNTITVSEKKNEEVSHKKDFMLHHLNWISKVPKDGVVYTARIRYRQPLQRCQLFLEDGGCRVHFEEEQKFVASGQSFVLYDGDVCLGGGVIV